MRQLIQMGRACPANPAYRAQQWAELKRELALLGPVNYDYFGGKAEFEKIVQAANEHSEARKSP
jgi:hypothetical protein